MEERGTLVDELRTIRQQLSECIGAAENLHSKLLGPTPKDAGATPAPSSESVVTMVTQIRRQANVLGKLLGAHHDFIGNVGANQAVIGGSIPAAAGY